MNAGVPWTAFSRVSAGLGLGGVADGSHDPEVQHLHEVVLLAVPAQEDVRRLDVAMHQAVRLGFGERVADLSQHVDGPLRRDRPEAPDQRVGVEASSSSIDE